MAQSKKTSTKKPAAKSSSKSSAPKKKSTPKPQEINPPEPVIPIRRELGAVLFLFLALFTGISYFRDEGAFGWMTVACVIGLGPVIEWTSKKLARFIS